jgi:hypothetical protein
MRTPLPSLALLALVACSGGGTTSPTDDGNNPYGLTITGPGVLSVSPLDTTTVFAASPLGSLAPPGHVLPTDHIYISFVDPWSGNQQNNDCRARPVYAAGAGVIDFQLVTEAAGDTKVGVQMTKTFHYYYDHVLLLPGMTVGTRVTAGQQIATTTGRCPSMDLGVWDLDATNSGFVNPARYGDQTLHAVSPYKYFSEPLRAFYYAHVRVANGVPTDKDGRIDQGIKGRLSGDWFHSSIANASLQTVNSSEGWSKSISFAHDWYDGALRISIGGVIASPGVLRLTSEAQDFASVSTGSGVVAYEGRTLVGNIGPGWLLVQMVADDRIKVQWFPLATSRPAAFTAAAQEYVR